MALQVESSPLGEQVVPARRVSNVDYIPTLDGQIIRQTSKIHQPSPGHKKQWGRVKNVAQIWNEHQSGDDQSDTADEQPKKSFGVNDFQRTARLLMKSRRVVEKMKTQYNAQVIERLKQREVRHSLDLSDFGHYTDPDMFSNYNLKAIHERKWRKKQLKIAVLQGKFLNELPELREASVKDRLHSKILALEKIKTSKYIKDIGNDIIENASMAAPSSESQEPFTRRQRRLRQSIDMSVISNYDRLLHETTDSEVFPEITLSDVDRLLAVSKSRVRIEEEMNLPADRRERLSLLKTNVEKINGKFRKLLNGNRTEAGHKAAATLEEDVPYYAPSRFDQTGMALQFFRKYARIVVIVTQWITMIMTKRYDFEKELKSFVDIANDVEEKAIATTMNEFGLSFDKKFFKANREITLSSEHRKILTTRWQSRTPHMIKQVMNGLQSLRSLTEYPLQTQEKLCKVAWYQTIDAKKLIVRQGHHAESFYFIISGTAFVKKMIQDPVTGELNVQVAARLTRGHSFGEIGLLFDTLRTATVESATPMELLVIGKEDFVRIFMKADNPDEEPDHIQFIKKIPFMSTWPLDVLKLEAGACLTHYFKRGSLITDNDRHSEWIYFIMTGTCEVLKKLKAVKPRDPRELRPRVDLMSDVILPEIAMANTQPKINSGKTRHNKRTIHPEVFQDMTNFYDSLRRRYTPDPISVESPSKDLTDLPESLPRLFIRTASTRKFSLGEKGGPRKVRFKEDHTVTLDTDDADDEEEEEEIKFVPLPPSQKERPSSRAKLDESTSKLRPQSFRVPSREKLHAEYRPVSQNTSYSTSSAPAGDVFVQVEVLYPKDCFGLNTLKYVMDADDVVFDVDGGVESPILSLVSRGAEVIMLSKKVLLKYADQRCKLRIRDIIKVYPAEDTMQESMQLEADWSAYKENVMAAYMSTRLNSV
ncbi:uncharacterized protein LOC127879129 [Dreissena polymorpha]|uniref:uncharacterized protein LOC127879129 n=1 Tax=Dreissena polymorpha TaxID=45954 RepID=UPI002265644A|nr:uncharacterized protein LOC127879129 [Dreissena polymorpha]